MAHRPRGADRHVRARPPGWRPTSSTSPGRTPSPSARSCRSAPAWPRPTRRPRRSRRCSPRTDGVEVLPGDRRQRRVQPVRRRRRRPAAPRFSVALDEDADAVKVTDELRDEFGAARPASARSPSAATAAPASTAAQLAVVVQAADAEVLTAATEQVRAAMAGTAGRHRRQHQRWPRACPRVDVTVDRAAAARAGLTEAAVGQSVAAGVPRGARRADHRRRRAARTWSSRSARRRPTSTRCARCR